MRFLVLVLVLVLVCRTSEGQVSCRNNNNVPVDWYILYKAPRMDVLTGQEYLYIDSQGEQKMLSSTPNYKPISHPTGVLANTLQHLFLPVRSMPLNHGFVLYSDQAPGCDAKQNFGHSKGILMIDKRGSGIWLLHSTPRFPYRRQQNNFWPSSANTNAQTFICVTFPYAQFQKIGKHLQYIQAFPYNYDIPDDFHQELQDAVNWQADSPAAPFYQELHSKANNVFYSFSKLTSTRPKDGDLYFTIAQAVDCDVYAQTWGCQSGRDRSFCSFPKKVYNVNDVRTPLGSWEASRDHSKWCVTKNQNTPLLCIADLNRATSQYVRTGGALCTNAKEVRKIFQGFLDNTEGCDVRPQVFQCSDEDTVM